jgi:cyanophycinase
VEDALGRVFSTNELKGGGMRVWARTTLAIAGFFAAAPVGPAAPRADPGFAYYEVGNTSAARPSPTQPDLLLAGGGDWPLPALRRFAAAAGHGHLVIVAASGRDEYAQEIQGQHAGFASVQTIVFTSRRASFNRGVLEVLRKADAIFIAGGDQAKYVRFWKGTPVARAIDQKISTGRPVGGTSAGLAILGAAGYGAMDGGSIESSTALANPLGPAVTMVRDFLHMPYLGHVITDTHFAARNRLGRLVAFLAQVRTRSDPRAIGLGIDQDSALYVDAKGQGRFYTINTGRAWLIEPGAEACRTPPPASRSIIPSSGSLASARTAQSISHPCGPLTRTHRLSCP